MHYLAKGSEVENPYDPGDTSGFLPAKIALLWQEVRELAGNGWK